MLRRIVIQDGQLEARREVRPRTIRTLPGATVLNVLQAMKPDTARFTVEGEGADIWTCDQSTFERNTEQAVAASKG